MINNLPGRPVLYDYSLLPHNTFGIDVKADRFFQYNSIDQLCEFIDNGGLTSPYFHIGGGSNLLFTKDYEGLILHSQITGVDLLEETEDAVLVRVGAGMIWDDFVAYAVSKGWYGLENLSLIPGEVGASAVQNIGAYGVEVKDFVAFVDTVNADGKERRFDVSECEYAYRSSLFKGSVNKNVFVTYVAFRLSKQEHYTLDYGTIRREIGHFPHLTLSVLRDVIIKIREEKLPDPKQVGNAGSFFMNPIVSQEQFLELKALHPDIPCYEMPDGLVKIPAGWMIESCGWKGRALGVAGVFHKQALVLVNLGGAKGEDIVALSDAVIASVREKFNIDIHPEVNFI